MSSLAVRLPVLLSGTHIILFLITVVSNHIAASNGNPLFCVDLPFSLPLVARDDAWTTVIVGIIATVWWYFAGMIGSLRVNGQTGRMIIAAGGAVFLPIICAVDAYALLNQGRTILRNSAFGALDVLIYLLAAGLLSGGLLSAIYAGTSCDERKASFLNRRASRMSHFGYQSSTRTSVPVPSNPF